MRRVSLSGLVGAITLMSTAAAIAADYPQPYPPPPPPAYLPPPPIAPPPPPPYYAPPPAADFGGWYLRGDIGMTNQKVKQLDNVLNNSPGTTLVPVHYEFDSGTTFGIGAGYQFNSWFRADVTAEYRGKTGFNGLEVYYNNGIVGGTDEYRGYKKEYLGLINLYADLGTWWCLTPFVGVGAGVARVEIGGFTDINTPNGGVAYASKAIKDNVAYALHAGVGYKATNSLTFELAYRYLTLGDGITGDLRTYTGVNNVNNPTTFKDLTSHDVRFGVRWQLEPSLIAPPPPVPLPALMRRG